MNKVPSSSPDLTNENIKKLKELFPEILTDGEQIDFDKLKTILGQEVNGEKERYSFNWHGKKDTILGAQKPSKGTLRPDKEKSKNFDTTENLYIEGDNLEVLKLLQKSYSNKIKMIYIDPPYNTGKDFVYKDNFRDGIENYLEQTGQTDSEGNRLSTNFESNGRYHTEWLNMMYPRLKLARNLLNDEGVIFISIDDKEIDKLIYICNEIFGESNQISILPTIMNLKGNNDQFGFAGTHEYTLVYGKKVENLESLFGLPFEQSDIEKYKLKGDKGFYKKGATLMRTGEAGAREKRPKGYYPVYVTADYKKMSVHRMNDDDFEIYPITKEGKQMSWRRSKENLEKTKEDFIIVKSLNNISFYKKQWLNEDIKIGKKPKSLMYKP